MAKKTKKHTRLTKKTADRHRLYQTSVQDPDFEVDLASKMFKRRVGRKALSLREDFCGTAYLCSRWVKSHKKRTATGVDIHPPTLSWGREHNIDPLGPDAERVQLVEGNVLAPPQTRFDVVCAFNYSYFIFKERRELLAYLRSAYDGVADDGILMLDAYGGWESYEPMEDEREEEGFDYTWDQDVVDPIQSRVVNHIHFVFPDGTELREAFTYDWRLWQLVEIREALLEVGFERVEVLWEGEDDDGEGNGEFEPLESVSNDPAAGS